MQANLKPYAILPQLITTTITLQGSDRLHKTFSVADFFCTSRQVTMLMRFTLIILILPRLFLFDGQIYSRYHLYEPSQQLGPNHNFNHEILKASDSLASQRLLENLTFSSTITKEKGLYDNIQCSRTLEIDHNVESIFMWYF